MRTRKYIRIAPVTGNKGMTQSISIIDVLLTCNHSTSFDNVSESDKMYAFIVVKKSFDIRF